MPYRPETHSTGEADATASQIFTTRKVLALCGVMTLSMLLLVFTSDAVDREPAALAFDDSSTGGIGIPVTALAILLWLAAAALIRRHPER